VEDENAVLKLAVRTDMYVLVDIGALADDASLADDSTFSDLRLVPDSAARTDGGLRGDFRGGMDENGLTSRLVSSRAGARRLESRRP
jgi:hypothetical protein